ncbi:exosortase/archaeosortase family protein [Planctomycetota bacterium]|nr:exosortase/archaeosortase family protein [Planctomycetota bacterium]
MAENANTNINFNSSDGHLQNQSHSVWTLQRVIAIIGLIIFGVIVTWSEWADVYLIAMSDEEASHILLVPIIIVWLIAARKEQIQQCKLTFSPIGPIVIALGWLFLWLGFNQSFQAGRHIGAILVVTGCFLTLTGWDVVKRFWPAFVVLGFMVPVPGLIRVQISTPMQTYTAAIAQFFSVVIGMNVERSGNVMSYNGVDVAVAEACNGMRMIFALLLVSFAFAFGTPLRTWTRILVIFLSPIVAIICNVIRLIPTVYVYGNYNETIAEAFHDYTGWFMLLVALGMLFGIVHLLNWLQLPVFPSNSGNQQTNDAKK